MEGGNWHEVVHSIQGNCERTQRRKPDGLNHQRRPIIEEVNGQSVPLTQLTYLRAKLGDGLELICDLSNPRKVDRGGAWDIPTALEKGKGSC